MKESFGARFARLRKEKGLTQDELAQKVNISPQAVSKWENDISSPDIQILSDLSEILGISIDELLGKEKTNVVMQLEGNAKIDINKALLKIMVNSSDGNKVNINLPISILKLAIEGGITLPQIEKMNIDLKQVYELIEQGVIGNLVEVESADGDKVIICVE